MLRMRKISATIIGICCTSLLQAQTAAQRIQKAYQQFEKDEQLKHAVSSLYVIDAKTGEVVFEKNAQMGLAPASTQKIITSVTAFEILGKEYRYKTGIALLVPATPPLLRELSVTGSGDPTFGSWRYTSTRPDSILNRIVHAIQARGIDKINGPITLRNNIFESQSIPGGWIWEDIANYYGAGAGAINWMENQYTLQLKPGNNSGEPVTILKTVPDQGAHFINELKTGSAGSGDNAYIYFNPGDEQLTIKGTIPCCVSKFEISGTMIHPDMKFGSSLQAALNKAGIVTKQMIIASPPVTKMDTEELYYTHYSPSLDSIIYWFLRKSINLYGEALIKTLAYAKKGLGTAEEGAAVIRQFWKAKDIDENELNIRDGSGLSPLNRVTTHAQVEILRYAKNKNWFRYFYDALPEYNGMKMKSGTISDVKGYCGYHTSKDGRDYIFSFLVNNYSGKTAPVVAKMFRVLDELKK
jgi:serine-type D-Ala-D-Ala carboxypeptidase/endopeptidase (penicillin-binding protein 4)